MAINSVGYSAVSAGATFIYEQLVGEYSLVSLPEMVNPPRNVGDSSDYRIYDGAIPEGEWSEGGSDFAISISSIASNDYFAQGNIYMFSRPVFLVKVVARGDSSSPASTMFKLIDSIIQGSEGPVTVDGVSYWVQGATRLSEVLMTEDESGFRLNHVGGRYRFLISPQ